MNCWELEGKSKKTKRTTVLSRGDGGLGAIRAAGQVFIDNWIISYRITYIYSHQLQLNLTSLLSCQL